MKKKNICVIFSFLLCLSLAGVAYAGASIAGDTIDYDFRSSQTVAKGNVVLINNEGTAKAANAEYNTKTEAGQLTGGVVAVQGEAQITCNTLVMHAGGDQLTAIGNAILTKNDKTMYADQVEYFQSRQYMETVGGWARLTMDNGQSSLEAVYINYDMKAGIANANGNVNINSTVRKLTASGDNAIYNTKEDDGTIELIGNATATQDGNTVSGQNLKLRGAGGSIAEADGNVKLVYFPKPQATKPQNVEV